MTLLRILVPLVFMFSVAACTTMEKDVVSPLQRAETHYKLGVAYLNEKKVQQAFVEFQKSLELNPQYRDSLNALGIIYLLHFDQPSDSMDYFRKALLVDGQYSEAYNNLGYAHERLGKYQDAIGFYKKAIANLTYATPEKAYINMGNSYYRLGRYTEAIDSFKEALKRLPVLGYAYLRLSLCYNALGRYGDASASMSKAIELDPAYKGDVASAAQDFRSRKLAASGNDEKDYAHYLEILKY